VPMPIPLLMQNWPGNGHWRFSKSSLFETTRAKSHAANV
jgi:hypothetical protein